MVLGRFACSHFATAPYLLRKRVRGTLYLCNDNACDLAAVWRGDRLRAALSSPLHLRSWSSFSLI